MRRYWSWYGMLKNLVLVTQLQFAHEKVICVWDVVMSCIKSRKMFPCFHGRWQRCSKLTALRWRHNGCDSVSNHQPRECLLRRLIRRTSKKTSKLRVTGLCVGNSPGPVNSPHKGPVTRKMLPFDDVIMAFVSLKKEYSVRIITTFSNIHSANANIPQNYVINIFSFDMISIFHNTFLDQNTSRVFLRRH